MFQQIRQHYRAKTAYTLKIINFSYEALKTMPRKFNCTKTILSSETVKILISELLIKIF